MSTHAIGTCQERLPAAGLRVPEWLSLAAAPTFALMALLTGVLGGGPQDGLCANDAPPLSGMVVMYLLMSAFHAAPWLRLMSKRHSGARSRRHAMDATRPQSRCAATR
ncbi:MAG TPA: hypothetical protein VGZ49_15000 [Xanthobacteraceae bacterium]|jgi:hypothetical protein|nr:hypothetical protein [Xanthobacteraceae bacterium]